MTKEVRKAIKRLNDHGQYYLGTEDLVALNVLIDALENAEPERYRHQESKPEYKPYENADELIADFLHRFQNLSSHGNWYLPLIWVEEKEINAKHLIYGFENFSDGGSVWINDAWFNLDELFRDFTYLDGTPCGKLVE